MHGRTESRLQLAVRNSRALTVAALCWCLSLCALTAQAQSSAEHRIRPNSSVRSVRSAANSARIAQLPDTSSRVREKSGTRLNSQEINGRAPPLMSAAEANYRIAAQTQAEQNPDSQSAVAPPGSGDPAAPAANSEEPGGTRQFRVPLQGPDFQNMRIKSEDGLLSLVVRDAPIRDVLTLLAETQGLNVVTADPLTQPISVTLERVQLNDALDAILSIAGYTFAINRNIILVSSLNNSATTLAPQAQGLRLEVFQLDFAMAQDVNTAVNGMLSPLGQAYVIASSPTENRRPRELIAVNDLPQFLDRIRQYIAQIDIPPRQVLIEAHVLQVDLDDENKHGVNFTQLFNRSQSQPLMTVQASGLASAAPGAQAFTFRFSDGNLLAFLEMLRTTQDAKTLASPRIMVLNGQQARLQVGQQLGFRVTTTTETSTTESVDFLDVGVVLEVTPHISRDGKVMMSVRPEVSSGQVNPTTGLPEEETTELETDIMLCDNEGIVIGGLIQETDTNNQSKLAWIGDIYIVGKLFQRREVVKERKEIIITLIPRVLPYEPCYDALVSEQFARTDRPLFYGPLCRLPRPEPQLPDVIRNPSLPRIRDIFPWWRCGECGKWNQHWECPTCHTYAPSVPQEMQNPETLPPPARVEESPRVEPPSNPNVLNSSTSNSANQWVPAENRSVPPEKRLAPPENRTLPPANQPGPPANQSVPTASQWQPPATQWVPPATQSMQTENRWVLPETRLVPPENQGPPPENLPENRWVPPAAPPTETPHTPELAAAPPSGRITGMSVKTPTKRLPASQQFGPNPTRIARPPTQSVIR